MAKGMYIGISSKARKVKKAYIGVGGVARKIKKMYIGVGGVARLFYSALTATTKQVTIDSSNIDSTGYQYSTSLGLTSSELATVYGIKLTNVKLYGISFYGGSSTTSLVSETDIIDVEGATDTVVLYSKDFTGTGCSSPQLKYSPTAGTITSTGGGCSASGISYIFATATIYYYT